MPDANDALAAILARCEAGSVSSAIALMEMLIAVEDRAKVARFVGRAREVSEGARAIDELLRANAAGCERVAAMLRSGVDSPPKSGSVDEGIAFCARLFDWSVTQSEEASVALYSLGNPALLEAATREVVSTLDAWGVLRPDVRALDVGCGIGRMEVAIAPRVERVTGIDVSPRMIEVARRRCGDVPNAVFAVCSGRDLGAFGDATFDLVLAIDSFPYLVQSGMSLVETHFAEARRVLRPHGDFVILNFSYRDAPDTDRDDVACLSRAAGLALRANGEHPFTLWNGSAFHLRKEP